MRRDRHGHDVGRVTVETAAERIVVGSRYAMSVTYAAGPAGIAPGGCVRFRLPGLVVPDGDGRGTVTCSVQDIALSVSNHAPAVNGKDGVEFGTEDYLFVTVGPPGLAEGQTLSVRYGADLVQHRTAAPRCAMPWRVEAAVDSGGSRSAPGSGFQLVPDGPVLEFVSDAAGYLELTIPSSTVVGEPFAATVRLRDQYHNLATGYRGTVTVLGGPPGGGIALAEHAFTAADAGVFVFEGMRLDAPGIGRLWAVDAAAGRSVRSNASRTTSEAPARRVYWGDTHAHSRFSADSSAINDRIPDPRGVYAYARDRAALDFCMVTDHVENLSEQEWFATQQAAAECNSDGRFVTFSAYEATFGPSRRNGDRNVYYLTDDQPRFASGTTEELYARLKQLDGVMVIPHLHVPVNWELHDPSLERVVEVYAHWGCGLCPDSAPPLIGGPRRHEAYVSHALRQGARLGFIASADHSWGHPGDDFWWFLSSHNGGLAAVRAGGLNRRGIWDAMWNRNCYATTRARILLEFQINGCDMGQEIAAAPDTPRTIAAGVYGTDRLAEVTVVKNGQVLDRRACDGPDLAFEVSDPAGGARDYYWLHAVQGDGEQAWCSPIWVSADA